LFYQPQVIGGTETLNAVLFDDADILYTPTVIGPQSLSAGLVTDTDVFYGPTVAVPGGKTYMVPASRAGLGSAVYQGAIGKTQIISDVGAIT
jgi:hypothetical protein